MESAAVPVHVLDTEVDIVVSGAGATRFARTVAARWHLAVSEVAAPARGRETGVGHPTGQDDDGAVVTVEVELGPDAGSRAGTPDGVLRGSDERQLLQRLTQQVTRAVIAARTGDLLMLHAGALAHRQTGAAVVFVAPGGTGKSTLCRVQGPERSYLTDETVGIRRDGTIAPYLKPISTRRPDWSGVKEEVAPADVGLSAPTVTPRLAGVLLLRRDPGWRAAPEVTRLDTLSALTEIAPETSGFSDTDRPLTWLAGILEETGGARRVTYGTADRLGPLIDAVCGPAA